MKAYLASALLFFTLLAASVIATPHSTYAGFAQPLQSYSVNSRDISFVSASESKSLSLSVSDTAVYRYAYASLDGQAWTPVTLSGSVLGGQWLNGTVAGQVSFTAANFSLSSPGASARRNFIVVYSCSRSAGAWDCHSGWQIWQFNASLQSQSTSWQQGMVSWWKFDGGVTDSVGGNGLTASGPSLSSSCVSGQCYSLDGSNDFMRSSRAIDLSDASAITVSIWVSKPQYTDTDQVLAELSENNNVNNDGFLFILDSGDPCTGGVQLAIHDASGFSINCYGRPLSQSWHHYTLVLDRTKGVAAEKSLYIDGVLQAPSSQPYASDNAGHFGNRTLYIGSRAGNTLFFSGSIDEVMLWNRALSSSEVAAAYSSFGYSPPSCTDTCTSLGYQCGIQTVCGAGVNCGTCPSGACNAAGRCVAEPVVENAYYVATNGNDNNPGTFSQPWATWGKALSAVTAGDTVYIRGGEYFPTATFQTEARNRDGTPDRPIRILNYPGEKPILNGQNVALTGWDYAIYWENCENWYVRGLEIKNFREAAYPNIARGFTVRYSANITFENCVAHDLGGDGFSIMDSVAGTISFINCDSYNNADINYGGEAANGFWMAGNGESKFVLRGCRAWNNSDDGIDFFYSEGVVIADSCWAFDTGQGNAGDGNGFKLGAASTDLGITQRMLRNCISANNKEIGFDQNEAHVRMELYNNVAYGNHYGFILNHWTLPITARNNIAYESGTNAFNSYATQDHNSWNGGVTVTDADFVSLDSSQLKRPRKADGSLPDIDFLKLRQGSDLIDAGVGVGLPYIGSAPDIGAFETSYNAPSAPIEIFIIGDSTAAAYGSSQYPLAGWGMGMQQLFDSGSVTIVNNAAGGASSKNYLGWPDWTRTYNAMGPGDYLFIQFGHNDMSATAEKHTDPYTTYQDYLQVYIDSAREKGAYPVLLTPIHMNQWSTSVPPAFTDAALGDYPPAMRQLAAEQGVALIDLDARTKALFESLGQQTTTYEIFLNLPAGAYAAYPNGISDNVHLQTRGGNEVASLVVDGIEELGSAGATYRLVPYIDR